MPTEIIDYSVDFCSQNLYTDLYPVKYSFEAKDNSGLRLYVKKQCICHAVQRGTCQYAKSCPRFLNAPAVILR